MVYLSDYNSDCSHAARFIAFLPQRASMYIHILICFAALATNCIFFRLYLKKLNVHFNCRVLVTTLVLLNIVHSSTYATMLAVHLIKISTVGKNLCDVMVDGRFCFMMHLLTSSCYIGHTTVLFGLLLERFRATRFVATYERSSNRAGYLIACNSVLIAILLGYYKIHLFRTEQKSYYCSSLSSETFTNILITHSFLLLMLIIIVVIFGMIFYQNRSLTNRIAYNISEKYQATENMRALRILAPLLIFHFICYPFYFTVSIIIQSLKHDAGILYFRVIYSSVYCPSYYCVISPLILLYIIRKKVSANNMALFTITNGKPQRQEDVYFENYRKMW